MAKRIRTGAIYLASTELWLVAFFVAASVLSTRILPLAVWVAGSFWVIRWLAYRHLSVRTPGDWAIAVLVLMIPVTLWASAWPEATRPQAYRLLTGVALYYAIANWTTSPARLRLLITGTVLSTLLLALGALVSVQWADAGKLPFIPASLYAHLTLLVSDTVNPNVMAGALAILLPWVLALLLFSWWRQGWFNRVFIGATVLVTTGVLTLTQSRSGLMALATAVVMMVLLRWRRGWLLLLALVVTGALTVQSLGIAAVRDAITRNSAFEESESRVEIWSRAWYMIQDFPFTGIGMGSFKEVSDLLYPHFHTPSGVPHAHNLFLQIALDLGIPGLIAWLAIFMLVTSAAWQVYRYSHTGGDVWTTGLGAGAVCSQIALVVHGLTDAVTWGMVRTAIVVWALWGLAIAVWKVHICPDNQVAPAGCQIETESWGAGAEALEVQIAHNLDRD